jgi:hypothetical protein
VGTQAAPSWQATHWPARQTIPLPHEVPFGWSPAALQTGAPVVQAMAPLLQGWPEREQLLPAAHATQVPPLQTRSVPHAVPLAWGRCVSVQVATPAEQVI